MPLEPKSFRVLLFLIENRGRVVTKEELMKAVWRDSFVTDNALTRTVAQLRKALGDHVKQAQYIETVPTVGYRFIAELTAAELGAEALTAIPTPDAQQAATPAPPVPPRLSWRVGKPMWSALALVAIIGSAGIVWRAQTRPWTEPVGRLVQFTNSISLDTSPSFSPDGSAIAYTSDRTGRFEIYVRPVVPGGREIQVTNDGEQNVQPAWSPDGRYLAYHSVKGGGVRIIPALGGKARQLSTIGSQPSWSPDSAWVAFRSTDAYSLSVADYQPIGPSTIWVAPAAGGEARAVTRNGHPEGRHSMPTWASEGRILFISYLGLGRSYLWSTSLNGELRQVSSDERVYLSARPGPDGHIYASAHTMPGEMAIWELGGRTPRILLRMETSLAGDVAISRDGKRLALSVVTMNSNLWMLPMKVNGDAAGLPALLTRDTNLRNSHAVFSPDGSKIAFFALRKGIAGDIWTMDADGGNATPLTTQALPEYMPSWMPDGKAVAYASRRPDGYWLMMTSLADGVERPLKHLSELSASPRLAPNGRVVVFHRTQDGALNLFRLSLDRGDVRQLTSDSESAGYACWSRDSAWLAFELIRNGNTHLAVIPADGGAMRQLTNARGQIWPFSWSQDGRRIAAARLHEGAWNLWSISTDGKEQKRLTAYTSPRAFVRYPSWSPKGDRMVYELSETQGNIYLLPLSQ
ncbi:MAG: winged helix-turn-helix domain-containing protein [Bryobacteraceae bacterium]